jgi:hypothetical protein
MNIITKKPIAQLGYDFIPKEFIPKGKDEYYLRNIQNRSGIKYRNLSPGEIKTLRHNGNTSDNWKQIKVSSAFDPALVRNCSFYGLVRIGRLDPAYLEFNNLRMVVGLYNSTIVSCDIGDNVAVNNVNYMSHYIIGNDVMLANINELATTNHSKFGNGVLKKGESESVRVWLEICNENAGRSILPFNGMLAGDAWLWSKYRDDEKLLQRFKEFTDKKYDTRRGYYGKIGDRTIIKNCKIIKDVWIGTDAYLKGANKLKNLTINSSPDAKSQIGEGCELVNGIIGYGCRVFYGVKAVRFVLSSNSQLKYGARLINSFLGDNSTISCCEVLNSLIFPAHEQHHNNSFLCAALVMGQSNVAAGATIGSNHNSRGADGELLAGRGFWPGLCVSLKHNSRFASFTLIAKADYPSELNIPIPFCLVNNDASADRLVVMPAYWFIYNMYALARNAGKYITRDKRVDKTQVIEYDFLAPDTINELFTGLELFKKFTGKAWSQKHGKKLVEKQWIKAGEKLLENDPEEVNKHEIIAEGFENNNRKVVLVKVAEAYQIFKELIVYHGARQLLWFIEDRKINSWEKLISLLPFNADRDQWLNIGGQLMPQAKVRLLIRKLQADNIKSWDEVHEFYKEQSNKYYKDKFRHSFASLLEIVKSSQGRFTANSFKKIMQQALGTAEWLTNNIQQSRAKDYENPFRKMVYDTEKEMEKVIGKLSENSFIQEQQKEFAYFKKRVNESMSKLFSS